MNFSSNMGLLLHGRNMLSHCGIANCGAQACQLCTNHMIQEKVMQFMELCSTKYYYHEALTDFSIIQPYWTVLVIFFMGSLKMPIN